MISIIIASITTDHEALNTVIDSILHPDCPFQNEVIVVTPYDLPKSHHPNVNFIKEPNATGSCQAYNYGLQFTSGNHIGITTDDLTFKKHWWDFARVIDQFGFLSFKTGFLNVPVPHIFGFSRDFLNGPMQGVIFNPALTHMYLDNDLGFRLDKIGFKLPTFSIFDHPIKHENNKAKSDSKLKSYKLDGMIFNHIWKGRHKNLPSLARLYPDSIYTNEELYHKMRELLLKDISGEVYGEPHYPWDEDYLDLCDCLVENTSENAYELLLNNMIESKIDLPQIPLL